VNKLANETLVTPDQVAVEVPGGPVDSGTVRRWINVGVYGVKLEALRRGGRILTSRQALERFFTRLNAGQAAPCA
jgi:hypothetical protein